MKQQDIMFGKPVKWWPVSVYNWPICQFHSLLHDKDTRLILNPPYQRGLVWDMDRKLALLDSLIGGLGVPGVYIRQNDNYTYEVIDGQQRIHTICSFIDDGFPLNGKVFSQHQENDRRGFEMITLGVTMLSHITDEEALEIYNRINFNGVPHEPLQRRNCI